MRLSGVQLAVLGVALVPFTLFVLVFPAPPFIALAVLGWLALAYEAARYRRGRRSGSA